MTNGFTPLTPVSGVTDDQLFEDDAGALLQQLEGKQPLPYADSNGIPTVGIGFNLSVPVNAADYFSVLDITDPNEKSILNNLFGTTYTNIGSYTGTQQLQDEIATQLDDAGFPALPALTDANIRFVKGVTISPL